MPITPGRKTIIDTDSPKLIAAIQAVLMTAADDSIRKAMRIEEDVVIDAVIRERYARHFAPRAFDAVVNNMRAGLLEGRLAIKDFAVFEIGNEPVGELFPVVTGMGPCVENDMVKVDVTVSAGDNEYTGGPGRQEFEGAEYDDATGIYAAEYARVSAGDATLYAVKVGHELVLDYGGLMRESVWGVRGLLVRGHIELRPNRAGVSQQWRQDLVVDDPRPQIEGPVVGAYAAAYPSAPVFGFPNGNIARASFVPGNAYSGWCIDKFAGKRAVDVLPGRNVHTLDLTGFPLGVAAFAGCFPRSKWIVRYAHIINGASVDYYKKVEWIARSEWLSRYGNSIDQWRDAGCRVPEPLLENRIYGKRIYAKFARLVIESINQ